MKWIISLVLIFAFSLNIHSIAKAEGKQSICSNRYLTLINPVRSRELWKDKGLNPLLDQYQIIKSNNFPATWLVQYDVLGDQELLDQIKDFDSTQEKGVFLEISEKLAKKARVFYPHDKPWYSPGAVFLSAYSQSGRRRLIDVLFNDFKNKFGYYPKSVGAWWIDSYSLNYLKEKYKVVSALIVANQKTTDQYGIWGQWWGVPYYPSKANILVPASNLDNKQSIVVMQWAQRHPVLAFGKDYRSSYSLQANDYSLLGEDTSFFKELVNVYLDCKNPVGQITVGIETGMESIGFIDEYKNQLDYLKTRNDIKAVTMYQFAEAFSQIYPDYPKTAVISYDDSVWDMNTRKRENKKFSEIINYQQDKAFGDYFMPDKADFLDRKLTFGALKNSNDQSILVLVAIFATLIFFTWKKMVAVWISSMMFLFSAYGLLLNSYSLYGFNIYLGPVVNDLLLVKLIVAILVPILFLLICKIGRIKDNLVLFLLPLVFGLDFILATLRISWISNKFYLGFATDALHFIGITFQKPFYVGFVNTDFPAYIAESLLRLDFGKIWDNLILSLVVYPLIHILLGCAIFIIIKKLPGRIQFLIIFILSLLFLIHLKNIVFADPRAVTQI